MKRTEHATAAEDFKVWREHVTPEEIAFWGYHATTLTHEEILPIIKQSLNDQVVAVQNGDDAAEVYHRLKVLTYADELTKREKANVGRWNRRKDANLDRTRS